MLQDFCNAFVQSYKKSFRPRNDHKTGKYKPDICTLGSHDGLPPLMTDRLCKSDTADTSSGCFSRLLGAWWVAASDDPLEDRMRRQVVNITGLRSGLISWPMAWNKSQ